MYLEDKNAKDLIIVTNAELSYTPKLFANNLDNFTMSLNLSKEGCYYSVYLDDWEGILEMTNLKKGDRLDIAGSYAVNVQKNMNNHTKVSVKVQVAEVRINGQVLLVDREAHNSSVNKFKILEYLFTNLFSEEKVKTSIKSQDLLSEMQAMLLASGSEDSLDIKSLKEKQDAIKSKLEQEATKKSMMSEKEISMFSCIKKRKRESQGGSTSRQDPKPHPHPFK